MSPVVPQQPFQPFQPFPVESPERPVLGLLRNFEGHLHDFSLAEPCGTPLLDFAPVPSCALSHRIFGGHQLKYFMINTSNSKPQGMVKSYTCFGKLRFGKCEFWIILGRWKHGLERLQPFWKHWILECEAMNIQGLNQVYLTARSCRIGYMLSVTKCPSASWPLPGRNLRDQWTDKTSFCRWCWF